VYRAILNSVGYVNVKIGGLRVAILQHYILFSEPLFVGALNMLDL